MSLLSTGINGMLQVLTVAFIVDTVGTDFLGGISANTTREKFSGYIAVEDFGS